MKQSAKNPIFMIPTAIAMAVAMVIGTQVQTQLGSEGGVSLISSAHAAAGQQAKAPQGGAGNDKLIIQIP